MELELMGETIRCYDLSPVISARCEETMESIVPDALPDIAELSDAEGTVLIRDKELSDGAVRIAGVVAVTVLYAPEADQETQKLDLTVPFTCRAEHRSLTVDSAAVIDCRLEDVTARALNPRKLLVRVNLLLRVLALTPMALAQGAETAGAEAVELRVETVEVRPVVAVGEKTFSLIDEQELPAGRPAVGELLKSRVALAAQEAKAIGNKVVFKGSAEVTLLYRAAEGGEVNTVRFELPFSQILELDGAFVEPDCDITLFLTGLDIRPATDREGRSVEFALYLAAQAVVTQSCLLRPVTDAYSLTHELKTESGELTARSVTERRLCRRSVRETMELEEPARTVCDLRAEPGEVRVRRGEPTTLETDVAVTVTYLDGEGRLRCKTEKRPVSVDCALPETVEVMATAACVDECYAVPVSGGVELRFELCFRVELVETLHKSVLKTLRSGEARDDGNRPSLVLKTPAAGESLWILAKRYGSTVAEILRTNGLEEETPPPGRLLLIPRKRGN